MPTQVRVLTLSLLKRKRQTPERGEGFPCALQEVITFTLFLPQSILSRPFKRGCRAECTRIDYRACGIELLKFLETSALSERPTGLKVGAQLEVGEQLTSHCRVYLKWGCPRSDLEKRPTRLKWALEYKLQANIHRAALSTGILSSIRN